MEIINPPQASVIATHSGKMRRKMLLIGIVLALAIWIVGAIAYFVFQRPQSVNSDATITNPISYFYSHFSTKDYHVRITGVTGTKTDDTSYSYYYEKGALVRIDGADYRNSQMSTILKDRKIFTIDNSRKIFLEKPLDDQISSVILQSLKAKSILDPILQGETVDPTPWVLVQRNAPDKESLEFQTDGRKFLSDYYPRVDLVDIRVVIDTNTGLITRASVKTPMDHDWDYVDFQYEEISNIGSLKKFPTDYKKEDPYLK